MHQIAIGCLAVGVAFLLIAWIIGPVCRIVEDNINRYLCWKEIRKAVRR
jgi:hypothetical protein